jgi:membrane protease YdiL (CAAX protease family)
MELLELSPAAKVVYGVAALASLLVLFRLFERHIAGRPLLPFEPRRAVPWNYLAPLLIFAPAIANFALGLIAAPAVKFVPESVAVGVTASAISASACSAAAPAVHAASRGTAVLLSLAEQHRAADKAPPLIWLSSVALLAMVVLGVAVLVKAYGADQHDLGLPTSWRQFRRDALIGAAAFAASLFPLYALMMLLTNLMQPTEGHPLIEQYVANPSLPLMAAAAMAAVVAAPIAEEIAFRMVFQGWLERIAVQQRAALPCSDELAAPRQFDQPPLGWLPIAVSSVVFGLAHWGQGVAPIPLILLGAVLGYVYQRTHRLAPGIVCHSLFNGLTLVMLWLEIGV